MMCVSMRASERMTLKAARSAGALIAQMADGAGGDDERLRPLAVGSAWVVEVEAAVLLENCVMYESVDETEFDWARRLTGVAGGVSGVAFDVGAMYCCALLVGDCLPPPAVLGVAR